MNILALETSTKLFSLAVAKDDKILRFRNIKTDKILEASMIPAVDKILKDARLNLQKIDVLAVALGPGSFTSLRVGLSTIKAFAMASGKKIVGIGSLDVLASGVIDQDCDEICTLLDARRGKVYAAIFKAGAIHESPVQGQAKTEYLLTTIDDVLDRVKGRTLFVGDGIALYKDHIEKAYKGTSCEPIFAAEKFWYPKATELAKLAHVRVAKQEYDDPAKINPIYLYPQDCQVTKT